MPLFFSCWFSALVGVQNKPGRAGREEFLLQPVSRICSRYRSPLVVSVLTDDIFVPAAITPDKWCRCSLSSFSCLPLFCVFFSGVLYVDRFVTRAGMGVRKLATMCAFGGRHHVVCRGCIAAHSVYNTSMLPASEEIFFVLTAVCLGEGRTYGVLCPADPVSVP